MTHFGPLPHSSIPTYFIWRRDAEIVGTGHCPIGQHDDQVGPPGATREPVGAEVLSQMADLSAWWFDGTTALPRVSAGIRGGDGRIQADGREEFVISDIPKGSVITIEPAIGPIRRNFPLREAETVTITSNTPGRTRVTITCPPPFLAWRGGFDAV